MRQIILDTETTGLSPKEGHRIIEIGCVELVNRRFTGNNFHQYINPGREIDYGALKVHGITQEKLQHEPYFIDVVEQLMEYLHGAELVIHNAPFDIGFLDHELRLTDKDFGPITDYCDVLDTLSLARRLHPGQRNGLDALCSRYEVDNSQRDLHGALLDAGLLAHVYLAMTGGQAALFGEEDNSEGAHSHQARAEQYQVDCTSLVTIKPDTAELEAHQAYLKHIRDTAGQCLWEDSE